MFPTYVKTDSISQLYTRSVYLYNCKKKKKKNGRCLFLIDISVDGG